MLKTLFAASAATLIAALACAGEDPDSGMPMPTAMPTDTAPMNTAPTNTAPTADPTGTGTGDPPAGVSYAKDIEPFFVTKCADNCHTPETLGGPGAAGAGASLDLSMGLGHAALQMPSIQVSMPVVGDTPENSYLWLKINDMQDSATALESSAVGVGIRMPYVPTAAGELTAEEMALVKQWIEGGAMP